MEASYWWLDLGKMELKGSLEEGVIFITITENDVISSSWKQNKALHALAFQTVLIIE